MMKTPPATLASPLVADPRDGGIRISITDQPGQRNCYQVNAVSLSMKKGLLEMTENVGKYFIWFDRCDDEIRGARRTFHFRLKTGAALNLRGSELAVLAERVPPHAKALSPATRPRKPTRFPAVPQGE